MELMYLHNYSYTNFMISLFTVNRTKTRDLLEHSIQVVSHMAVQVGPLISVLAFSGSTSLLEVGGVNKF